jgi:hypothetical protein
MNMF